MGGGLALSKVFSSDGGAAPRENPEGFLGCSLPVSWGIMEKTNRPPPGARAQNGGHRYDRHRQHRLGGRPCASSPYRDQGRVWDTLEELIAAPPAQREAILRQPRQQEPSTSESTKGRFFNGHNKKSRPGQHQLRLVARRRPALPRPAV